MMGSTQGQIDPKMGLKWVLDIWAQNKIKIKVIRENKRYEIDPKLGDH